ncbi:hypothetical protein [Candidatus Colwellia aromaticivorans]|uniref:hypothetical protein n=1 Tax=Candidatus Colwellia aromaticivorans TaxID=2267621 RepID=UPI000DF2B11B|nr:hypothetical protein [Candidatus Colwellia aromaticivorans]
MSNTEDLSDQKPIEQEDERQTLSLTTKPLHRQFSTKLVALLLTIIIALALIFTLFYQQSERSRFLIDGELTPLKQQFEQLQTLQKADYLVNELLFTNSGINFIELQTELIALNRRLLRLESLHTHLYQQWLNTNKSASDIVMRIQQNHGRNEQLKQSSIIQLQLMLFSVTPIINKKTAQQELLFKQLQTDQVNDNLTFSRANAYVSAIRQLDDLQQLKSLLAKVLTSFEQLTIHTSMDDFYLLRLGVEQIIAQHNALKIDDKTKATVEFSQQIDTFEDLVITQQRALAKWQGYIRLAQSYQLDLKMQKNQLMQILVEPQEKIITHASGMLNDWLVKFKINVTQKELSIILFLAICLSMLVFCFLLWRLREQIKLAAQQSVVLINKSIHAENSGDIQANCAETQEIMQQVQSIAKPVHNEQEFQQLLQQCQTHQQVIDEQAQLLTAYTQNTDQQQLDTSEQVAFNLKGELQRYKHLEEKVLSFIQHQQAKLINTPINNETIKLVQFPALIPVYEQLKQFYLASDIRSEKTVLTLVDVNLVDEIHAILMNKQTEQQKFNNQLYFSYDEQLLEQAKLDFRLFQQLMHLLIDIVLVDCQGAQLHLHLQLQDKSGGQQLVHFVVKVRDEAIETLPDLVTLLINYQKTVSQESPLVEILNILFTKQHGEHIIAHLIDDGFQLSFELPLAIASSPVFKEQQETKLDGIKVMLLSSNKMLTGLLEKLIHSASGKFEVLARIDSFEQQLNAKYLSKHKLDLLIVASDVAQINIDLITRQLDSLPNSLQPKLMLLQSAELSLDGFGFYSQAEQLLFKDVFLQNIKGLLIGEATTNQLLSPEQCQQSHYLASELPVVLAVHSPQKHQNFQRLLHWLGLQVHVVSHADAQRELWETGLYCILFTEFTETSLLEMVSKPLVDVAVFSLTDDIPSSESNTYFDDWHIRQLVAQSTLADLRVVLAPWLKYIKPLDIPKSSVLTLPEKPIKSLDDGYNEGVITELVASLAEDNKKAVFDFSQYLHHQGSVELALFMLDDYAQANHQQLDVLIDAIKVKDFDKAKEAIIDLRLNAKILAASELELLCSQWSKLLSGNDTSNSLNEVNALLKETRAALTAIDSYAESI